DSSRARVAHAVILPLAFALPLVFLGQALRAVPMPEEHLQTWLHFLRLAVFGCVTWLLVRIVGAVGASILRHNPMEDADNLHALPMPDEDLHSWLDFRRLAVFVCVAWLVVRIVGAVVASILLHNPMEVADNLHALLIQPQTRALSRVVQGGIIVLGAALALM